MSPYAGSSHVAQVAYCNALQASLASRNMGKADECITVVQLGIAGFGAGLTWAGIVVQWG